MAYEFYVLDGPTDFYFPHPVRNPEQITVEMIPGGVLPKSEYEVIGYGPNSTGVTIRWKNAPLDANLKLRVSRRVSPQRLTYFEEDEGATARALNEEFDNVYQSIQDFPAPGDIEDRHADVAGWHEDIEGWRSQVEQWRQDTWDYKTSAEETISQFESGYTGFNENHGYDFGSVTTAVTYFNRDFGEVSSGTEDVYILRPTLTVEGSPSDVPEEPTLETNTFSVANGSDTHQDTDWQIRNSDDTATIWESLADTSNLISIQVPAGELEEDTEYIFKVRHRGETYGVSAWAGVTAITDGFLFNEYDFGSVTTADTSFNRDFGEVSSGTEDVYILQPIA